MMMEEDELKDAVKETREHWEGLKKGRREYLISCASDEALELVRPYLNDIQSRALLKMDAEVHEARAAFYGLQQELAGRFPEPAPPLPPVWQIDPVAEARRSGKSLEQVKGIMAMVGGAPPPLSGTQADQTLRKRWQVDGQEIPDLNAAKQHHEIPALKREVIHYGEHQRSGDD